MNVLKKLSEDVTISNEFIHSKTTPEYSEPMSSEGNTVSFEKRPFPDAMVNGNSRVSNESKKKSNKKGQSVLQSKTVLSTVVSEFIQESGINKYPEYGAGTFVIVKSKLNPDENFLLMGQKASNQEIYTSVFGGTREMNNGSFNSGALTVCKELFEETMGTIDLSLNQVEGFVKEYGVHNHNRQARAVLEQTIDGEIIHDKSFSYDYQTTVVEIEVENPKEWIKNSGMQEHVQTAQKVLNAFEIQIQDKEKPGEYKNIEGFLALMAIKKEGKGLSAEQSIKLKTKIDFKKVDKFIDEVVSKTLDGQNKGFRILMDKINTNQPVTDEELKAGADSLLNHTEINSYELADIKSFQQAARTVVEDNLSAEVKILGRSKSIKINPREAMTFERLRFESLKRGLLEESFKKNTTSLKQSISAPSLIGTKKGRSI